MAVKTTNRRPIGFNVGNLNEKYFNFAEFNGLCDNKNYLGINQNTFTDVDNLYIDQDSQLSSRPPIKRINFLYPDEYVIKVYKINSMIIYHTKKEDKYWIHFEYKDVWYSREVTERINIMWFDTRYVIFMENDLIGFNYNYELKQIQWFSVEEIIYTPISEIISNGTRTPHESSNAFTTSKSIRYMFDSVMNIDTVTNQELIGKSVTVNIGNESFKIIWQLNNEKVFTTNIGNIDADLVQVASNGRMLAVNIWSPEYIYFSLDGTLFYSIKTPDETERADAILADDGSAIWLLNDIDTQSKNLEVLDLDIKIPADIANLSWQSYSVSVPKEYTANLWINRAATSYSRPITSNTSWAFKFAQYEFQTFSHSPEIGKYVAVVSITGTYMTEHDGTVSNSRDKKCSAFIVFNNGTINIYPQDEVFSGSNEGQGIHKCSNKVRLLPSNTTPLICISAGRNPISTQTNVGDNIRATIVLNSSYIPYHYYHYIPFGNLPVISRQYFAHYTIIPSFGRLAHVSFYAQDLKLSIEGLNIKLRHVYYNRLREDKYYESEINIGNIVSTWPVDFADNYNYPDAGYAHDFEAENKDSLRRAQVVEITMSEHFDVVSTIGTFPLGRPGYTYDESAMYKIDDFGNVLTDRYFRHAGNNILLLKRNLAPQVPLHVNREYITYYDLDTKNIYDNTLSSKISVDLLISGSFLFVVPYKTAAFVSNVLAVDNKVYIASKREGKIYIPIDDIVSFPNEVTALVNFTQTSLGIFLEDEVHELIWNSDNNVYTLSYTKLQLGCRYDSEILLNYDGETIFITTLKGLNALDYQDFVQSTEHVYSYLTENILSTYDKYSVKPLKLTQFKNWIFMYRTDVNYLYLYDLRNKSWWKWTNVSNIQQIIFDGNDLLVIIDGVVYSYNFNYDVNNYFDDVGQQINWTCTSQRLHFNAPNNYKHIKSFSIITSQEQENVLRCKLQLKSYHNLQNLIDTEVVEYELDQLTTAIYKVNFFKLNAFQFTISSDRKNKRPTKFITPDIAIKYRITERVR